MDMDPVTRREAEKIEEVLHDLVHDLELLTFLPDDFNLWLRDDIITTVDKSTLLHPELEYGNSEDGLGDDGLSIEEEDERQHLVKASCFLHAAAHYGDPADSVGNEAIIQVNEFNELERELQETATNVGHINPEELEFHHLSLRALLDTMKDGEYGTRMVDFLRAFYPAPEPELESAGSSHSSRDSNDGPQRSEEEVAEFDRVEACAAGITADSVEHVRHVMAVLTRLMELRNASTVSEDIHRYKVLHEAVNKEQSATADVQALNREYEEVKAARKEEVAALDHAIAELEEEFYYVQHAADVELEAFREMSLKIQGDHRAAFRQQLEQHQQAAEALEAKLKQLQAQHVEETNQLRSLRAKKEAAVSGAINEYDTQTATLTAAIEKLQKESEEDTTKIAKLEERLGVMHKEKHEYEWELEVAAQRESHLHEIRQRQEQCARVLQAYYRAYIERLNVEKEMAKLKKKKKKRKGGKKKK